MKSLIPALICLPLLVTACGAGASKPGANSTASPSPSTSPTPDLAPEDRYLAIVRAQAPALASKDDHELILAGQVLCDRFREGQPLSDVLFSASAWATGEADSKAGEVMVGAAQVAFCPEFVGAS